MNGQLAFEEKTSDNGTMNVFFVSNSTCYYFTDELYGILAAAGYENANLALVYYSGCSIQRHHEWYSQNSKGYQLRLINRNGLQVYNDQSLADALMLENWDFISFDNNARTFASGNAKTALSITEPYFGQLYSEIKKKFPSARYLWHQVWSQEIGYDKAFQMVSLEQRHQVCKAKHDVMEHMIETYGVGGVPTGDAWEKVRDLPIFTKPLSEIPNVDRLTLCSRLVRNTFKDDFSHDGDVGGGQYLNACVWFEILTGKSCVGNHFRPSYQFGDKDVSLTEEKIAILQNAAHEAVCEYRMNHK